MAVRSLMCKTKFLLPATKSQQGNVFTPVCDSVHGGGSLSKGVSVQGVCQGDPPATIQLHVVVHILLESILVTSVCDSVHRRCVSQHAMGGGVHPPRQTPWADSPPRQTLPKMAIEAGGTHPTGMHSCLHFSCTTAKAEHDLSSLSCIVFVCRMGMRPY